MSESPCGSTVSSSREDSPVPGSVPPVPAPVHAPAPAPPPPFDPARHGHRLPVRILAMLSAHAGHVLHPDYLQPVTIELDAKKSPLALLAQTCSQIGKPDPTPSSKLGSLSSGGLGEKDGRSSGSGLKSGEQHQNQEDKSSFKPYSKGGLDGCRKDGVIANGASDKSGFRVNSSSSSCPTFPPHSSSPRTGSPSQHGSGQHGPHVHRQTQSPATPKPSQAQAHVPQVDCSSKDCTDSSSSSSSINISNSSDRTGKKDSDHGKASLLDNTQLANSSHVRATVNSSSGSSSSSPQPSESKAESQPSLTSGHIAPVSPFKPGHSVFPLPPSTMGYHGSIIGAYAGYPSQFVSSLDPAKSGLAGMGIPGKHPSSSPLTGASPPSFMQGLCRDPYCLTYPNAPHLSGGSNCTSCVHDPSSSSLKSGFPLMYPSPHLHALHSGSLSSAATGSLSHPLFTYGFMLPSESLPHACNWVSMAGPCDKRFATSEELLAHLRTHTALPGMDGKLLSGYPSSMSSVSSCHLHLPPPSSPGALPSSFSLRGSPGLSLARYHPYSKAHLSGAPSLPMHSLPATAPYYSPYALYGQRLGSASALGYP
ncbi:zinc finger protein 703 [Astyanax mexicanus]|uniref:zinc finger protein 703 n=1 Tax=Astyanax mexicanus TaxID=7994 RepID=UPI0020CA9DE3|nr:zinc finger protein 703 [Astyanax mexicanus]